MKTGNGGTPNNQTPPPEQPARIPLQINVNAKNGTVVVSFNIKTNNLGFPPDGALEIAQALIRASRVALTQNNRIIAP